MKNSAGRSAADMQVLPGRLLVKSPSPEVKARGIALLEKLAQAGQWNAKAELAIAIRNRDPVRARPAHQRRRRTGRPAACMPSRAPTNCAVAEILDRSAPA
jgi:hypothetical protein